MVMQSNPLLFCDLDSRINVPNDKINNPNIDLSEYNMADIQMRPQSAQIMWNWGQVYTCCIAESAAID
jgi:hypothetical protein